MICSCRGGVCRSSAHSSITAPTRHVSCADISCDDSVVMNVRTFPWANLTPLAVIPDSVTMSVAHDPQARRREYAPSASAAQAPSPLSVRVDDVPHAPMNCVSSFAFTCGPHMPASRGITCMQKEANLHFFTLIMHHMSQASDPALRAPPPPCSAAAATCTCRLPSAASSSATRTHCTTCSVAGWCAWTWLTDSAAPSSSLPSHIISTCFW